MDGKFVGYISSTKILRIWIPSKNKVIESTNVKFATLDSGEVAVNLETRSNLPQAINDEAEQPPHQDTLPIAKLQLSTDGKLDDPSKQIQREIETMH
uniref:Bgt-20638 n=1 Tax=Blumeria graminis f. sp. tritici 96224 TaxID=1268274 RepID=A0A381LFC1_BLUGR